MFNADKLLGGLLSGAMGTSRGLESGHHGKGLLTGAAGMAAIASLFKTCRPYAFGFTDEGRTRR